MYVKVKRHCKGFSYLGHINIMIHNGRYRWYPTKYDYCAVEGWVVRVGIQYIIILIPVWVPIKLVHGPARVNNNHYFCLWWLYSLYLESHGYNTRYILLLLSTIYKGHYIILTGNHIPQNNIIISYPSRNKLFGTFDFNNRSLRVYYILLCY